MVTRRDLFVALIGVGVALASVAVGVQTKPEILSSTVFDWTTMTVQQTTLGARRGIVQAPTATLDELEIHITTLHPGETAHPPHQHPAEELLIIKDGNVESLVNGQLKRVGPGSIIFQASNQLHSIRNVGDAPATYHVIQWQSPGMLKRSPVR